MATDKPRFSITVSDDVYQQINDYQHEHRLATQTKAVLAFIEKGLEVVQKEKKPPTGIISIEMPQCDHHKDELSIAEQTIVQKYRHLDQYWKKAVDSVLNAGYQACTDTASTDSDPDNLIYITKYFPSSMSAGTGQPTGSDYYEELDLVRRPPRGTSYIAPVSGDSMEPTFHDGDKLFIKACERINPGQVGVFYMDGQQWVKELGEGILISHNEKYEPIKFVSGIQCQGLVLGVCDDSYFK